MCSFSSIFSQLVFQKLIISIFSFSKYNSVIFLAKLDLGLFISFFFWFVCSSSSIRVMTGRKQQGGKKQRFWLSLQLLTFLWCCPLTPLFVWQMQFFLSLSLFKTRISDVWACVSSSNFTFLYYRNLAQYPRLLRSGIGWNYLLKETVAVRSVCLSRKHLHIYLLTVHHWPSYHPPTFNCKCRPVHAGHWLKQW